MLTLGLVVFVGVAGVAVVYFCKTPIKAFEKRTVESITSNLNKMVAELHEHADAHLDEVFNKTRKADVLKEQAIEHATEATKARTVAEKIGALTTA